MRRIRYGRTRCRGCGAMITNNALGRARHSCERELERQRKEREQRDRPAGKRGRWKPEHFRDGSEGP